MKTLWSSDSLIPNIMKMYVNKLIHELLYKQIIHKALYEKLNSYRFMTI